MNNMYLKMMAQGGGQGKHMPLRDDTQIIPVDAMQDFPEVPQMDGRISDMPPDQVPPTEDYIPTPEEMQMMGLTEEDVMRGPSSTNNQSFWRQLLGIK
jgi:hypothetical protein